MKGFAFAALLFLCSACATLSVNTDYNPAYDFSRLRTYAWLDDGTPPGTDARINNDLVIDRVRSAVEWTLAAKGYVKSDAASADFRMSWLGVIDKKLQLDTIEHFYSPYGYGSLYRDPFWADPPAYTTVREYEVGTLIIDVLDPVRHKLIWRGTGSDRLSSTSDPVKITREINAAVSAILKDFPPVR
ncbi:MAG: DUF4136 domain-containing protein [Thermodesulfobacteriota bacterium]